MASHGMRLFLALILLLPVTAGQGNESPEVQLRAAMHKELVEGDLPGAIELYQKVAANRDAPRVVVARALLQMGLCYERLGNALAHSAYRRLVDGYPEQLREVQVAKWRLAEMARLSVAAARKPAFQHVQMTAKLYEPASLSHEGDRLAFTSGGSLWTVPVRGKVRPEIAGVPERLTKPMWASGQLAWSRDGNWIAFNAQGYDLYVIPSTGGEPTKVVSGRLPAAGRSPWDYAIGLSPDGTKLAYVAGPEGQEKVHLIPVTGGTAIPLSVERSRQPAFSPDGRWIACVTESWTHKVEGGEPIRTVQGVLWVASSDGADAVLATEVSGRARSPVWSPDGRMIAFLRDDGATSYAREVRIIQIREDGRPAAPSKKLELPFATQDLLAGWTARNEIGILESIPGSSSIHKVAVMGGRAARISARHGDHPRWSPDGSRIYFRDRGNIVWIPAGGGEPTNVPFQTLEVVEAVPGGSNEPSPDGSALVLAGYLKKPGGISVNIWTVPSNGGLPRQITDFPYSAHARFPSWSPDGKSIAFVTVDQGGEGNIYIVPAGGGESRRITSARDKVCWARLEWSPDGEDIAYFSKGATLNLFNLRLFNLRAGDSRILAELHELPGQLPQQPIPMRHNEIAWSPGGRQLAYTYSGTIWLVPLDNPQPVRVETGQPGLNATAIDWSPDGNWLVFRGHTGTDCQLHLMTDFMSIVTR